MIVRNGILQLVDSDFQQVHDLFILLAGGLRLLLGGLLLHLFLLFIVHIHIILRIVIQLILPAILPAALMLTIKLLCNI
jgi:hypothetical protein